MQALFNFRADLRNDPSSKGQLAAAKRTFGPLKRYAVAPIHTRFDAVTWFVWDAEAYNEDGDPAIIRQADTLWDAVKGLPLR